MGPEWWTEMYLWLEDADPEFRDLPDEQQHARILDALSTLVDTYEEHGS